MIDLGTLGGNFSVATAINTQGEVVGGSYTVDGPMHAFLWQSGTGMVDLGTLVGDTPAALVQSTTRARSWEAA
jgi:probable HAF family extracellular repeat protein